MSLARLSLGEHRPQPRAEAEEEDRRGDEADGHAPLEDRRQVGSGATWGLRPFRFMASATTLTRLSTTPSVVSRAEATIRTVGRAR